MGRRIISAFTPQQNREWRNREIYQLHLGGMKGKDIAERLNLHNMTISRILKEIKKQIKENELPTIKEMWEQDLLLLNNLIRDMKESIDEAKSIDHRMITALTGLLKRKADMLGFDSPSKMTFTDIAGEKNTGAPLVQVIVSGPTSTEV